ncbi:bifunctional 3,4-dihydroxy-2-butanone 4-phosphate synthase/GTP cyclohydrolase II [Helicobacter sp. MIT 21-1697]|uniref:bifunctional 3,4-dihydroxy-2-butanone 4-phosphate synthase/GTP cyclohydrolase II n=1 Tax=Helicobacter sp. MIT 21-1697 TaxID=2993733 RepID=UPI00224B919C|nr:bifunctional 3,4-dihydroxy-2-butanone 4-phosphate synthase/GTP cyclohydrolase II [Helicobacter sp. MIT 21-1697]MCX2717308.1 bifunctional 3,4-dihydroxy-2-butanone 4-phosphate synthase/GTP cyclohydrolase II [Helicobacter sp. MIT 21-1697]
MYQQRIKEAIEAIKQGEMIIIMDDEDRENEGDLVMAGIFSTPQKINFMAQEARGLICVSITQEIAKKLDLPPMVQKNDSNHETAFTISIDAKDAKTGISAFERDMTIKLMCESNAKPSDFVRPGHIFPLIAKEGGVLVRTGHTEASVDICRLAGVAPISVICEIMKKDGTMAGRGDKFLLEFASLHNLKILYVSDIIQYRLNFENLLREVMRESVAFMGVECEKITFIDHLEREHIVFRFCQIPHSTSQGAKPLIRFHNVRSDLELLQNAQEWNALLKSIERLKEKGGYLVFLNTQIGYGSTSKTCGDMKDFGIGAQILKRLGIEDFVLLSSCGGNKGEYNALSGFNLHLVEKIEV